MDDHLAENIVVINLDGKSTIGDYMVIATGHSSRQVITLAEHLTKAFKEKGLIGIRPEGIQLGDWVLIDAGDVFVPTRSSRILWPGKNVGGGFFGS